MPLECLSLSKRPSFIALVDFGRGSVENAQSASNSPMLLVKPPLAGVNVSHSVIYCDRSYPAVVIGRVTALT